MRARGNGANVIVTEIDPTKGARSHDGRLPRYADGRGRAGSATFSSPSRAAKSVIDARHLRASAGWRHHLQFGPLMSNWIWKRWKSWRGRSAKCASSSKEFTLA